MPLPLLFIGIAVASGMFGVGGTVKAGFDAKNAKQINKSANELVQESTDYLNAQRLACGNSLTRLGAEKMAVLNGTISDFLNVFTQIKNVDFKETEGLDELHRLHIDEQEFVELRSMAHFAGSVAGGAVAGTAGGALAAFGAYGAAQALAFASTGTAISALSGAAATNATLAFFGGGSLAAGGLGMAGGTAVLGGLVAGPALLVMGLVAGKAAKKDLEKAYIELARVGIEDKAGYRADELSGGQQQRVGIARAMMQDPKLVLADEPVASLDPVLAHSIMQYLEKINSEDGVTVLCSLHFLDLVHRYADRVVALNEGRLVFDGLPSQIDDEKFKEIYGREAERIG